MASDPVQLVITIFARRPAACEPFFVNGQARPLEQKGPAMREQIFTLHITELLISILGHADVKLQQSKRLSRNVSQSKFLLSGELIRGLPGSKPCDIQHHQAISWFEKQHSVEVLVDDYPPPPLSLAKGVGDELRRPIKLAVFDMDSTLIDQEVIDELARSIGVEPAVSAITHRAMNGELDFAQSLIARVALLAGVKANVWEDLKKTITIASGAKELCQRLREQGVKSAVISGGFEPMAKWLQGQLGLDYAFANQVCDPLILPLFASYPLYRYFYPPAMIICVFVVLSSLGSACILLKNFEKALGSLPSTAFHDGS